MGIEGEQRSEQKRLVKFRIEPVLYGGGKHGWSLSRLVRHESGALVSSSVQTFTTLKKAKAAAQHLYRKSVEV